jgi:hypothetical protein
MFTEYLDSNTDQNHASDDFRTESTTEIAETNAHQASNHGKGEGDSPYHEK